MLRLGHDGAGPSVTRSGPAYVAAWRHVHDLFAAEGVRGFWVWSPNADVFAGARGGVDRFWPGDAYVDWIGADGFNWNGCNGNTTWRDFGTIFKAFYAWGSARAKPPMISGTGTVEDAADPGPQAGLVPGRGRHPPGSMPRVRPVVLLAQGGRCDWRPDTSASSMQGFADFARDPFFGGTRQAPPAPPTAARPTTTTVAATTTTAAPITTPGADHHRGPDHRPALRHQRRRGRRHRRRRPAGVDAHGAGTRYAAKAGTHLRNFSVRPKSGNSFCGEPGAVLDGGRSPKSAFSGGATNVTLDVITVQQYASGRQAGAIHPDKSASGWVVRNVSAVRNYWAGLMAADNMKILGGHYNDNDQLGIGTTSPARSCSTASTTTRPPSTGRDGPQPCTRAASGSLAASSGPSAR